MKPAGACDIPKSLILLIIASTIIQLCITLLPSVGDGHIYIQWIRALVEDGLAAAYWDKPISSVNTSGGYYQIDYPPVVPFLLYLEGILIKNVAPSVFVNDLKLLAVTKIPFIVVNITISYLIFWKVRKTNSSREAVVAASFYAFNPAVIYNTAFWGQSDGLCALLILLSFILIDHRRPISSWIVMTLAAFTKPIAYPFAIILALYTLKTMGTRIFLKASLAVFIAGVALLLPFVWIGRISDIVGSLFEQPHAAPYISANAHNLWWIIGVGLPWLSADHRVFGFLSYETLGMALFIIFLVFALSKLFKSSEFDRLYFCLVSVALGFFILFPYMHSYHLVYFLSFCPLILLTRKNIVFLYLLFSILSFANMLLYDLFFIYLSIPGRFLTMIVSQLSLLAFFYWFLKFYTDFEFSGRKLQAAFIIVFLAITTFPFVAKAAKFDKEYILMNTLDSARILSLPDSVNRYTVNISNDIRPVLYESPPAEISYDLLLPESALLSFGLYIDPATWTPKKGDGVVFEIRISSNASTRTVFSRYIDPKSQIEDRKWHDVALDLSEYGGKQITLTLITKPGPRNNRDFDWAGWSDPRIMTQ